MHCVASGVSAVSFVYRRVFVTLVTQASCELFKPGARYYATSQVISCATQHMLPREHHATYVIIVLHCAANPPQFGVLVPEQSPHSLTISLKILADATPYVMCVAALVVSRRSNRNHVCRPQRDGSAYQRMAAIGPGAHEPPSRG